MALNEELASTCADCRYRQGTDCRRHAPVVLAVGSNIHTVYPQVGPDHGSCGDLQLTEAGWRRRRDARTDGAPLAMEYRSGKDWRKGQRGTWPRPPGKPGGAR